MIIVLFFSCSASLTSPSFETEMITFQQSTFDMGMADVDVGPYGNSWKETAQPQHEVTLSSFQMDKTEVPVRHYVEFLNSIEGDHMGSSLSHYHPLQPIEWTGDLFQAKAGREEHPMNYVSYYDALTYCGWRGSSLPTEAMWERAAKGDDRENPRRFPWADGGANCSKAVYFTNATLCSEEPQPVGSFLLGATPEGLLDMGGNVSEWVWDWFERYDVEPQTDPKGPSAGTYKIVRGGGFRETSDAMRVTDRVMANPLSRSEGIGFRCARGAMQ